MQDKSEHFSEFSERTDKLSERCGLSLRQLADFIGISQAMLFAHRNGKNKISRKTWAKLEQAELDSQEESSAALVATVETPIGIQNEPSLHQIRADLTKLTACMEQMSKLVGVVDDIAREVKALKMEVRTATMVSVKLGGGRDATEEEKRATAG